MELSNTFKESGEWSTYSMSSKFQPVARSSFSFQSDPQEREREVGKRGEKKGMAKYITKKLISTVFIWNILKYNNM
jgi:hypothetical protein